MVKDTSISIRLDSRLKEQTEHVLQQLGLNMTAVVNMLFHQIVRDQAIPLSLSLQPKGFTVEKPSLTKYDHITGYREPTSFTIMDIDAMLEGSITESLIGALPNLKTDT